MAVPEALAPGTKWQGGRTIRPAPARPGLCTLQDEGVGVRGEIGGLRQESGPVCQVWTGKQR